MSEKVVEIYARTAAVVPFFESLDSYANTVPAEVLADEDWLTVRVADMAKRWGTSGGSADNRINGTLWWYSASSILTGISVGTGLATGFAADPTLATGRIFLRGDGYLGGFVAGSLIPIAASLADLGAAMYRALAPVVEALSGVSGVRENALWAIVADSITNRCLDAAGLRAERGSACGAALIDVLREQGALVPAPRFVDVADTGTALRVGSPLMSVPMGRRRFTQRASCCLIYEVPGQPKCSSCPKRAPEDRVRLLAALV